MEFLTLYHSITVLLALPCTLNAGMSMKRYRKSRSGLTEVPKDIKKGTEAIHLDHNQITHIRFGDFSNFSYCYIIVLSYNKISEIDDGSFLHASKLNTLQLDHNALATLKLGMWKGLCSLRTLSLKANRITALTNNVFHFNNTYTGLVIL